MKTVKYKKVEPKLSEEIERYSKIVDTIVGKNVNVKVFFVEIPYNGFKIVLAHPLVNKSREEYYYKKSKYGWWIFCAQKDKLDKWDEKLLRERGNHYGQYTEGDHSFCNDNMSGGKEFYNFHPNEMVDDLKQQINIFLRDKEIEIARSKMTAEDYQRIEERANAFLESVVKENRDAITELEYGKDKEIDKIFECIEGAGRGRLALNKGWLVKGKRNTYFVDSTGKSYNYAPKMESHMRPLCIMAKWDNKHIHLYDHVASRILALMNDDQTQKFIHTIKF